MTNKPIGDQLIAAAKKIDSSYSTDNKNDLSGALDESTTERLFGSSISNNQQMWWTVFGQIPGISYTVD